ncbi:hypothetical protein ACFWY9_43325 [Amycolatopsis sp. NPDC059027]|uniref:hypothetical protein n=1 Tax=Amycolatopsis sp. NPDC059027 TaxID=3346709 RepID=UPI003672E4B3
MKISELAGRIRDQRFDGWTNTAIATEIERMTTGDGIGSIGVAVDALKSVADALAQTDHTLRTELAKMGVEWQSQAGGQAGQVFTEQAGFSQDAKVKVTHAAEMIFAQGEAFNRARYKLPDAETVRKGAGGFTFGDTVLSLIGFETDHARQVSAANNARGQALAALNEYAKESGENLLSTETLSKPEALKAAPVGDFGATALAGSAVDLTPDGSVKPAAAEVRSQYVEPPPQAQPVRYQAPAPAPVDPPTPAYGIAAQAPRQTASGSPAGYQPTAPSSAPTAPAGVPKQPAPAPSGWVNAPGRGPTESAPARPGLAPTPAVPPTTGEFVPPGAPGSPAVGGTTGVGGSGGTGGGPGGGPGPTGSQQPGRPVVPGGGAALPGGTTGADGSLGRGVPGSSDTRGDQALGKGRTVGAAPQFPGQAPQPGLVSGSGVVAPKPVGSAGELGAGAAAIGAGGIGGALSGERDRQGRGFGSGGSGRGKVGPLPVGELPEEEAVALRKSEQISPKQPRGDAKLLSKAAPQDGQEPEDAEHVRRYGVDDKDLFEDQRMVSPDVIGDKDVR